MANWSRGPLMGTFGPISTNTHPQLYAASRRQPRFHAIYRQPTQALSSTITHPTPQPVLIENEHAVGLDGPLRLYDIGPLGLDEDNGAFNNLALFESVKLLPTDTMEEKYIQGVRKSTPIPSTRQNDAVTSSVLDVSERNATETFISMPPTRVTYSPPREYTWKECAQAIEEFDWAKPVSEGQQEAKIASGIDVAPGYNNNGEVLIAEGPTAPEIVIQHTMVNPRLEQPPLHKGKQPALNQYPDTALSAPLLSPEPSTVAQLLSAHAQMNPINPLNPVPIQVQALQSRFRPDPDHPATQAQLRLEHELNLLKLEESSPRVVQAHKEEGHSRFEMRRSYADVMEPATGATVKLLDIINARPEEVEKMAQERQEEIQKEHLQNGVPEDQLNMRAPKRTFAYDIFGASFQQQRPAMGATQNDITGEQGMSSVTGTHDEVAGEQSLMELWEEANHLNEEAKERHIQQHGEEHRETIQEWCGLDNNHAHAEDLDAYIKSKVQEGQMQHNQDRDLPPLHEILAVPEQADSEMMDVEATDNSNEVNGPSKVPKADDRAERDIEEVGTDDVEEELPSGEDNKGLPTYFSSSPHPSSVQYLPALPVAPLPDSDPNVGEALSILKGNVDVLPSSPTRISETSFPSGAYDHEKSSSRNPSSAARSQTARKSAHGILEGLAAGMTSAARSRSPKQLVTDGEASSVGLAASPAPPSSPSIVVSRRQTRNMALQSKSPEQTEESDKTPEDEHLPNSAALSALSEHDEAEFAKVPSPTIPGKRAYQPNFLDADPRPTPKKTKVEVRIDKKSTRLAPVPRLTSNPKTRGTRTGLRNTSKTQSTTDLDNADLVDKSSEVESEFEYEDALEIIKPTTTNRKATSKAKATPKPNLQFQSLRQLRSTPVPITPALAPLASPFQTPAKAPSPPYAPTLDRDRRNTRSLAQQFGFTGWNGSTKATASTAAAGVPKTSAAKQAFQTPQAKPQPRPAAVETQTPSTIKPTPKTTTANANGKKPVNTADVNQANILPGSVTGRGRNKYGFTMRSAVKKGGDGGKK